MCESTDTLTPSQVYRFDISFCQHRLAFRPKRRVTADLSSVKRPRGICNPIDLDRLARPVGDPGRSCAPSSPKECIKGGSVDGRNQRRQRRSRGARALLHRARIESDPDHRVHR